MSSQGLLYLHGDDVRQALPMPDAIAAMREAFTCLATGQVTMPPRTRLNVPQTNGLLLLMPCHSAGVQRLSLKVVTQFNHNQTGFPLMGTHRALECGDCHRDLQTFKIVPRPTECASCHEADYRSARFPHAAYGAGRNCQECHLQDTWVYAHSPYWFNIQTGRHAGIACTTCHKNAQDYREYSCHECHAGHSGDRNGRCLDCHPGGFPGGD